MTVERLKIKLTERAELEAAKLGRLSAFRADCTSSSAVVYWSDV